MQDRYITQLSDWQVRARTAAEDHDHNETKRAVNEVEMTKPEREAAGHLFSLMENTIHEVCSHALKKTRQAPTQPPLELQDVLQESYILFLRALVHFDPEKGSLRTYLLHALRSRVTDYLRSKSHEIDDRREEDREPLPSRSSLPGFDVPKIVDEMVEDGQLSSTEQEQKRIERMWERLGGT